MTQGRFTLAYISHDHLHGSHTGLPMIERVNALGLCLMCISGKCVLKTLNCIFFTISPSTLDLEQRFRKFAFLLPISTTRLLTKKKHNRRCKPYLSHNDEIMRAQRIKDRSAMGHSMAILRYGLTF